MSKIIPRLKCKICGSKYRMGKVWPSNSKLICDGCVIATLGIDRDEILEIIEDQKRFLFPKGYG